MKVVMVSHDPGGANVILPLVSYFKKKGIDVILYGQNYAINRYLSEGYDFHNLSNDISISYLEALLRKERPDFVITATSENSFLEKFFWIVAKNLKIKSIAILDQWINYGIRFSEYSATEVLQYNKDKRFAFLPDYIGVMDELSKKEAVAEGLDENKIIVIGQPHFQKLSYWYGNHKEIAISETRVKLNLKTSEFIILYASENMSEVYGDYYGFNELDVFDVLCTQLVKLQSFFAKSIVVIVKPHPKEVNNKYKNLIDKYTSSNLRFINASSDDSSLYLLSASDLICGISSMLLIESVLLGKQILSIMIGLKKDNPFVLDRIGIVNSVLSLDILYKELFNIIIENKSIEYNFPIVRNASQNLYNFIRNING